MSMRLSLSQLLCALVIAIRLAAQAPNSSAADYNLGLTLEEAGDLAGAETGFARFST